MSERFPHPGRLAAIRDCRGGHRDDAAAPRLPVARRPHRQQLHRHLVRSLGSDARDAEPGTAAVRRRYLDAGDRVDARRTSRRSGAGVAAAHRAAGAPRRRQPRHLSDQPRRPAEGRAGPVLRCARRSRMAGAARPALAPSVCRRVSRLREVAGGVLSPDQRAHRAVDARHGAAASRLRGASHPRYESGGLGVRRCRHCRDQRRSQPAVVGRFPAPRTADGRRRSSRAAGDASVQVADDRGNPDAGRPVDGSADRGDAVLGPAVHDGDDRAPRVVLHAGDRLQPARHELDREPSSRGRQHRERTGARDLAPSRAANRRLERHDGVGVRPPRGHSGHPGPGDGDLRRGGGAAVGPARGVRAADVPVLVRRRARARGRAHHVYR